MRPLRIVRIVARLNVGGPAVHIINLATALDAAQYESHLIAGLPGEDEGDMSYLAAERGVETTTVVALGRELSPMRDVSTVLQLTRLLRKLRPDIVETHTAKAGAVGRIAARLAGVPAIIHVFHGHVFHSYFGPWKTSLFRQIERFLGKFCTSQVLVISESQRRDIVDRFRIVAEEKVRVVPLGFDLRPFADATRETTVRRQLGAEESQALVGLVGRLTAIKNPKLLLSAAKLVRQRTEHVHFALIGDGELRSELEQFVQEEGLSDLVTFVGWRQDMPSVYGALDIVALTSDNEGTPVSLIEAMAAAKPVVATQVGGVPDVVTDQQSGLLTNANDPQQLAEALWRLIADEELRKEMGAAGQQDVMSRFRLERLVNDMDQLYQSLAADSRKRT